MLAERGAARTLLERVLALPETSLREVNLLTELVYGSIRQRGTLDHLLGACAKNGLSRIEDEVLAHLRVAAYQLLFLEHVPPAVAVSEAVAAVGERSHVRGFVNGVLRGLSRRIVGRVREDAPPADVPATRRVPGRERGWVLLSAPMFPDPAHQPAEWLAAAASLPLRLARTWVERFGLDDALELARAQNAPPPVCLRVNRLRATHDELLERLTRDGLSAHRGEAAEALILEGPLSGAARALVDEGLATVQDETAMGVAPFLAPQRGERVLDLCAAPGGKTGHLAELMGDEGRVDAVDVSAERLAKVEQAVTRLGLRSVRITAADPADPRPPGSPPASSDDRAPEAASEDDVPIDRVLVDAPCSNTGVLRRRVEARWRLDRLDRAALLRLQARLLERALDLVRPGGVVVYSTCAIDPDENEAQVAALLARREDARLLEQRLTLPRRGGGDGGFMARIERTG